MAAGYTDYDAPAPGESTAQRALLLLHRHSGAESKGRQRTIKLTEVGDVMSLSAAMVALLLWSGDSFFSLNECSGPQLSYPEGSGTHSGGGD
jgi:hypothetical protein